MRDEEESLPVGSKVPQPMVSMPVCTVGFLNQPAV